MKFTRFYAKKNLPLKLFSHVLLDIFWHIMHYLSHHSPSQGCVFMVYYHWATCNARAVLQNRKISTVRNNTWNRCRCRLNCCEWKLCSVVAGSYMSLWRRCDVWNTVTKMLVLAGWDRMWFCETETSITESWGFVYAERLRRHKFNIVLDVGKHGDYALKK